MQTWWNQATNRMLYYARDEAYQRHHFRFEVEENLKELVRQQQGQTYLQTESAGVQISTLREGFDQLGFSISGLEDTLSWAMESVAGAIDELNSTLSWGLAEITWQQEQTNQLLTDVLETLRHPIGTQAEELRARGNEHYRNALASTRSEDRERWKDLALEAYRTAAEYNPADFSVFHSMGVILFFEKGNSGDALHFFREAAILAEPYSKLHAAMSWIQVGYIKRNRNEMEEAYEATAEARGLDPEGHEAFYQHAVHCALTNRMQEMEENLAGAISADSANFLRATSDPDLLPVSEVRHFLSSLRRDIDAKAKGLGDRLQRLDNLLNLRILSPQGTQDLDITEDPGISSTQDTQGIEEEDSTNESSLDETVAEVLSWTPPSRIETDAFDRAYTARTAMKRMMAERQERNDRELRMFAPELIYLRETTTTLTDQRRGLRDSLEKLDEVNSYPGIVQVVSAGEGVAESAILYLTKFIELYLPPASQQVREYSKRSIIQGEPINMSEWMEWIRGPTIYTDAPYFDVKKTKSPNLQAALNGKQFIDLDDIEGWLTETDSEVESTKDRQRAEREQLEQKERERVTREEEEEAKRMAESDLYWGRHGRNQCVGCGKPLGTIDRLLKRLRCSECR